MIGGEQSSSLRILIVEDEQLVAMDAEMQLIALGYEVTGIAATGKEALRLAETTQPNLILMDIQLRGSRDGFATAAELQQRMDIPIVFVTAFGNEEAKRRAKAASPYEVLTKPYRPEDLRAVVSAAVEQHRTSKGHGRHNSDCGG
jgi:CheY-like chemotaxis protein